VSATEPGLPASRDRDLERWREFVVQLDELGRAITSPPFPADDASDLEGLRHLALQAVCWMEWSLAHQDPRAPMFQRQNDLVLQWGGPNADNIYRHARVHPSLTYRVVGRMHSCDDFILAVRRNFMHMEGSGTIAELSAHEIGIGPGDDFEILLGGAGDEANRVPLPDGALSVSIREYYFDWQPREPATFTIECLEADGPSAPFTSDSLAFGLDEAATHLRRSLTYWNRYMLDARADQTDNGFGGGYDVKRGLAAAKYAFCFFDLAPDEALVVDCDIPQSRYWSFHLYSLAWWEALEFATRVTTRNHTQTRISRDGRVRVVVAHDDPGVANWLDTAGRREALLTLRWFWPEGDAPTPVSRVVKFADVRAALPDDEPVVTTDERRAELRARRDHVAWRFRT
jgi:Protein of unknown function (DUF1214)